METEEKFVSDDTEIEPKDDTTQDDTVETTEETPISDETTETPTETVTSDEENATLDLVQLEQRITSLEQRLLSVETTPAPAPVQDGSPQSEPEIAEESDIDEPKDDNMESTDDIKKLLDL